MYHVTTSSCRKSGSTKWASAPARSGRAQRDNGRSLGLQAEETGSPGRWAFRPGSSHPPRRLRDPPCITSQLQPCRKSRSTRWALAPARSGRAQRDNGRSLGLQAEETGSQDDGPLGPDHPIHRAVCAILHVSRHNFSRAERAVQRNGLQPAPCIRARLQSCRTAPSNLRALAPALPEWRAPFSASNAVVPQRAQFPGAERPDPVELFTELQRQNN